MKHMKISDTQVQGAVQLFLNQVNKPEKTLPSDAKTAPPASDKVNLSPQAAEMQKVKDIVKATPDVRPERVEQVKTALAAGEYQVSAEDVAEMIIGRSIADKLK